MKTFLIYTIGIIILIAVYALTWKYSNYSLYSRINAIDAHIDILARAVSKLQQEDVYIDEITQESKNK